MQNKVKFPHVKKMCRESHPEMLETCFWALVWEQANCCQNLLVDLSEDDVQEGGGGEKPFHCF